MEILAVGQRNAVDRKSPVSKSAGDVCPPSPQLLRPCNPGFKKNACGDIYAKVKCPVSGSKNVFNFFRNR